MEKSNGVLDLKYYEDRQNDRASKYRLLRRTYEVKEHILKYKFNVHNKILDIGAADARMLDLLSTSIKFDEIVGLDYSYELIKTNKNKIISLAQGDAVYLPFKKNMFDIVVATAVIEHVADPVKMVNECYRVLDDGGICIITTPDPFFEKMATKLGCLRDDQHNITMDLRYLNSIIKKSGFEVLKSEKFMISPIGCPYERQFESVIKKLRLGGLLLNQMIIGKK